MFLFHLCYASGNSEPGKAAPTLTVAKQRVDNYGSAFLAAGASAVVAGGHSHSGYLDELFTTAQPLGRDVARRQQLQQSRDRLHAEAEHRLGNPRP